MPNNYGLQVGTMLGKAMGQPLDFTRLNNYLVQQSQIQKQNKIKIMKDLGAELASYNPNGILKKDIKDFHRLYNNWKKLAVENIDVLENPQRDLDRYMKVMGAKEKLDVSLAKMKEANIMKGRIIKTITEQGLKGKKLAPDAMQYWTHIKQTPTLELNNPIDLSDILRFNPSAKDIMEEADKAMDKGIQHVDVTFPSVEDNGKTLIQYKMPTYESLATSANKYFAYDTDLQNLYSANFKDLSDAEKEDRKKRIANMYKRIPAEFLGGQANKEELMDFDIDTPEKLFEADYILSNPPQLEKTDIPNQTYFKVKNNEEQAAREKTQNQHFNASQSRITKSQRITKINQLWDKFNKADQSKLDEENKRNFDIWKERNKGIDNPPPPPEVKTLSDEAREENRSKATRIIDEQYGIKPKQSNSNKWNKYEVK